MSREMNNERRYFSILKKYEKAIAVLMAPLKAKNIPHSKLFIERKALEELGDKDRTFFLKVRQERREMFRN